MQASVQSSMRQCVKCANASVEERGVVDAGLTDAELMQLRRKSGGGGGRPCAQPESRKSEVRK